MKCDIIDFHALLGKKWTYGLLHNISDKISYNELYKMTKKQINPKLLSERLKAMVKFKIIETKKEGRRVYYKLTEAGLKLKRILGEIKQISIGCKILDCCRDTCEGCSVFNKNKKVWS